MNWIHRYIVRIGKLALVGAIVLGAFAPGEAKAQPSFWFSGRQILIAHAIAQSNDYAVSITDPALRELLNSLGATITWRSGERYILIATAQPTIVSFALGDTRYDVGPLTSQAGFAPFMQNGQAYIPFYELLRALSLEPKRDGETIVLQPQLSRIDVESSNGQSVLSAQAALPLKWRKISDSPGKIVFEFDGVGSTLERTRAVNAAGLRAIILETAGTVRNPKTILTALLTDSGTHGEARVDDRGFSISFSGGSSEVPVAAVTPLPEPLAAPSATVAESPSPAQLAPVTGVEVLPSVNGLNVMIATSGNATYDWHRLGEPDNRFWVDIHGAQLRATPGEAPQTDVLVSMRVRQMTPDTVRIALTLKGPKQVNLTPSASGLAIAIANQDSPNAARTGSGSIGDGVLAYASPDPASSQDSSWKFSPSPKSTYEPANPKLIVIDPGHGGSDPGAVRDGISEKNLALDMSKRLRDDLISRGWQVQMTRTTDADVYQPNDSPHDELQARCDVANNAGAALFVSVHVNSFINSGPRGTTTYYSKPVDVPLARDIERRLAGGLGTKDDGMIKSRLYVTLHTSMPAVLIETAFLSNPDDYARLTSPDWRQKVADAIADGIGDYTGSAVGSLQTQR